MTISETPEFHPGVNSHLLLAIPSQVQKILDVGCGNGRLGEQLKAGDANRVVFGVEREPEVAQVASKRLDKVYTLDVQREAPWIEDHSLDCLVFGDVLEHLIDPGEVLQRLRPLLKPNGWVVASIPNSGHHSIISALLRGDWQYQPNGLFDVSHVRVFTFASAMKLFLDAGYACEIVDTIQIPASASWQAAILPMAQELHVASERLHYSANAYQLILRGQVVPENEAVITQDKVSFSVCVSDEAVLEANLLASPDLQQQQGSKHEILLKRGVGSAAASHNQALEQAQHTWVICLHEDVYLPKEWMAQFLRRIAEAEASLGQLSVVGVYGIAVKQDQPLRAGRVLDRMRLLQEPGVLPCLVQSLDELLIAVRKDSGLRFDPALGWHLYGTEICLAAQKQGLRAAVVDALCFHNQRGVELPAAFHQSAEYLKNKWPDHLPLATPCMVIR